MSAQYYNLAKPSFPRPQIRSSCYASARFATMCLPGKRPQNNPWLPHETRWRGIYLCLLTWHRTPHWCIALCDLTHGGDAAVADVFVRLELAKVVPWNREAYPLAKAWEGQSQECAVLAASVVGPEECFWKLWLQGLHCQEGVLDWGCNGKPVLGAFLCGGG